LNDVFCPSLFDYAKERFDTTRECLQHADGLCARDLQAKYAEKLDRFVHPKNVLLFPEYIDHATFQTDLKRRPKDMEVHVVSVGTFTLERQGMYDSGYLRLAELLTEQHIHFHIYPHWSYRNSKWSIFTLDPRHDLADFFDLAQRTPYLHIHESLPLDQLKQELQLYDFGIVVGGSAQLNQWLSHLKPQYMSSCYSGRIADYIGAGLPVLVNKEVKYNFWLLKRYGALVDIDDLHQPGFRDKLLALRTDARLQEGVRRAAEKLSLKHNIGRLVSFYESVITQTSPNWANFHYIPGWWRSMPFFGKKFRTADGLMRQVSKYASSLYSELERAKKSSKLKQLELTQIIRLQQSVNNALLAKLGSESSGINEEIIELAKTANVGQSVLTDLNNNRFSNRSFSSAKTSLKGERGEFWANELVGLLNWPEIMERGEQTTGMPELIEMIEIFRKGDSSINTLSSCWEVLGYKNMNQLLRDGYSNFKRTVGCSYFNFLVQGGDPQLAFLEQTVSIADKKLCSSVAKSVANDKDFALQDQYTYRYFVLLLWVYAQKCDRYGYLTRLKEPAEGNPLIVPFEGVEASQDLANAVLEYYSMEEVVPFGQCRRVLEIGGGYGRDAFVILSLNSNIQYTMVDIPPSLWIAQRYLSSVFPALKVFHVRDFNDYEEVRVEMAMASIVFLLPHQLALLPDRHFDFSLNISSFGEMQSQQIENYFSSLERVTNGHFYMKQWKLTQNAFDNLILTEHNYPVSPNWKQIYSRTCNVQTAFFEAMYSTQGS
jgi:putative sugar O-methyltransferase